MRLIDRVRIWLVPALLAAVVVLTVVYAARRGVISTSWLKANKDAVAAVNSIVSMTVVLVASVLGYYRFFRGRTWTTRADLALAVDIAHGPGSTVLHSI